MFEHRTTLLVEHIDYLRQYLSGDMEEMPSRDELEDKLFQFRCDIDALKLDLPYDTLDGYEDPIDCSISDMWDRDELEDAVAEAESIIEELEGLISEAETVDRLADEKPSDEADSTPGGDGTAVVVNSADADTQPQALRVQPTSAPFSPIHFMARMLEWTSQTLRRKYETSGHPIPSCEELDRMASCCVCLGKANRDVDKAAVYAKELFPGYLFTEEEFKAMRSNHIEILIVVRDTVQLYDIVRDRFNFDNVIRSNSEYSYHLFHKEYLKP